MNAEEVRNDTDRGMRYARGVFLVEYPKHALTVRKIAPLHYEGKLGGASYTFTKGPEAAAILIVQAAWADNSEIVKRLVNLLSEVVGHEPNILCLFSGQAMYFWGVRDLEKRKESLRDLFPDAEITTF